MIKVIAVAIGGALGALARYGVSGLVHKFASAGFPWGTLVVNVTGCFFIGVLWSMSERTHVPPAIATFVFIGFLGSFTTFSTFGFESLQLLRDGEIGLGIVNVVASNILGLLAAYLGFVLARFLTTTSIAQ